MHTRLTLTLVRTLGVTALATLLAASARAQGVVTAPPAADTAHAGTLYACYVPPTGLVYRIKGPGLPNACVSESHVAFSWIAAPAGPPADVEPAQGPPRHGIPSQNWSLFGNRRTDPRKDKLGTTDSVDLVLVTNNREALRITAEGDIKLQNSLEVGKDLTVRNNVFLNTAGGQTINHGDLTVDNGSATRLTGTLVVTEATTLNSTLAANGQVTINAPVTGVDSDFDAYPLRVQGGNQGVAIRVNGARSNANNFVTFLDASGIWGRIEGQTNLELTLDPEYVVENAILLAQEAIAISNVAQAAADQTAAATSSTTGAAGPVPVVTVPIPSLIVAAAGGVAGAAVELATQTAQLVAFNAFKQAQIGVTYQSGAGDYAEWLPKAHAADRFYPGDIVGVRGGLISARTEGAEQVLVISYRPAVLANMPAEGTEAAYEKVAFLGQVPVKVTGVVERGDYIIPSGRNDRLGRSVKPNALRPEQYQQIVGVAWSSSETLGINYVNVAVGLHANDVARLAMEQATEIARLQRQLDNTTRVLAELVPGYRESLSRVQRTPPDTADPVIAPAVAAAPRPAAHVVTSHPALTRRALTGAIQELEERMRRDGEDVDRHPFFARLRTDAEFKERLISGLVSRFNEARTK